ncbi:MAG: HAD family hydrolase [Neptuniibacter sp.]
MTQRILITDIDNTLTNFVDYFSPCFRAMVHALHSKTGICEDIIYDDYISVFQNHGSIEYTFATQELNCLQSLSQSERDRLVYVTRVAFGQAHKNRLKPYPEVKEFLGLLKACGWDIYAVTNAPVYRAYLRLKVIGVDFFSGLSAWEGRDNESLFTEENSDLQRKKQEALLRLEEKGIAVMGYQDNEIKPNSIMFEHVLEYVNEFYSGEKEFWALGDNILNDLSPCKKLGIKTVWAKYGSDISPKELNTMMRITPWQRQHREKNKLSMTENHWDHSAERFRDLYSIFEIPYQESLL